MLASFVSFLKEFPSALPKRKFSRIEIGGYHSHYPISGVRNAIPTNESLIRTVRCSDPGLTPSLLSSSFEAVAGYSLPGYTDKDDLAIIPEGYSACPT